LAMAPSHSEVRGHRPTRSLRSTGRTKVCWNPNEPGVLAWENSGKIQGKFMMLICLPWCPLQKLLEYLACCLEKKIKSVPFHHKQTTVVWQFPYDEDGSKPTIPDDTRFVGWTSIKQQLSWCWAKVWIHRHIQTESISQKWLWIKRLVPWWTAGLLAIPKKNGGS
jgi:hypothetical protein